MEEAVKWCEERGLAFDYINENTPEHIEWAGGDTRKIYADIYIDDKAVAIDDYLGGKSVKIELKGTITTDSDAWAYEWLGMPSASPRRIAEEFKNADGKDVVLEINSYGGSCTAATEIRQIIKGYEGKVTANILCAMSAATVIACAADMALMSDTGIYMIHNSQSYAAGDYRDMEKTGDMLKQFNEGIINAYEEKTGLSRKEIQTLMDKDTSMSPSKAMSLGFVDGIIESTNTGGMDAAASILPLIPRNKVEHLKNIIKENKERFRNEKQLQNNVPAFSKLDKNIREPKKGEKEMTLSEFLNENPQAKAELDELVKEKAAAENTEIMEATDGLATSAQEITKTAEEAKAYGLIDEVITRPLDTKKKESKESKESKEAKE